MTTGFLTSIFLIFIIRTKFLMAESGAHRVGVTTTLYKFYFNITSGYFEKRGRPGDESVWHHVLLQPEDESVWYDVLFFGTRRLTRGKIEGAVKRALGGERDDQKDLHFEPESLRVRLHCFTDERFLEVLKDYESGKMKDRLQQEFWKAGIEVDGLTVQIENMGGIHRTKEAIKRRYYYILCAGRA